ncbi:MAG: hypothetical protein HF314_12110 [Ignavibacteria bacterium]|jgi:hypothetical protein|nr:hypothetical protein [Ignavibacteria bacterium]MCU7503815.1 hypothetical protein [Ignavibacteria bacterium]MCU7517171.1 hypothetical protein [Ignavibacteria bacterium]
MADLNSLNSSNKTIKLFKAGFKLYRQDFENLRIKIATTPGAWKTFEKFPSKAALIRRWNEIMQDDKNIEG